MSDFAADWLALREPADARARHAGLCRQLRLMLDGRPRLRVVDLGAGTGANLRYLAPRLTRPQHWVLVERDAALLAEAEAVPRTTVTPLQQDLAVSLDGIGLQEAELVTASALLDLVSAPWLDSLITACRDYRALLHFALTVDGRIAWSPADPEDPAVLAAFRRHQSRDKGFGPALGGEAAQAAERLLQRAGYRVRTARSDWLLDADQATLQDALVEGQAVAAKQATPALEIDAWLERRRALIADGRSTLRIGHRDLLAWRPT